MFFCNTFWDFLGKLVSLVSPFLTSFVAIMIFSRWKTQKGSEVVANECKSLIIKLATLQSLQSDIFQILKSSNGSDFPEYEFSKFKNIKNDFFDSMNFLGFALADDKSFSQLPSMVGADVILFIRDIENYRLGKISVDDISFSYIKPDSAFDLTQLLLGYAMYQKTISKGFFRK